MITLNEFTVVGGGATNVVLISSTTVLRGDA